MGGLVPSPDRAAVIIIGIDLVLASSLLLAILWRGRSSTVLVPLIIGLLFGFGLAIAIDQMSGPSNRTQLDGLERRVSSIETDFADLENTEISGIKTEIGGIKTDIATLKKPDPTISNLSSVEVTIASARVARYQGKPVVYMTVQNVGKAPATISGYVSFCPEADRVELESKECTSAPQNTPRCPQTFLCSGFNIGVGGHSREQYATIPPGYIGGQKSFRILVKLCDDSSGKCDINLTKSTFKRQAGPGRTLEIGDFVKRPDYDPKT